MSIYFNRGVDKYNDGNFPGALNDFSKAIELIPDFIEAYYNRGILRIELAEYQGVIEDF
ncbi:tetratricopeptide repeat protein, partial [Okeania sp. SIO2B9]|nr:tetratricopeptide repeat protein [Okeania sp. SIO2B9]